MMPADNTIMHIHTHSHTRVFTVLHVPKHIYAYVQVVGGEDAWDALSLQVISCKTALYLVALLRKETCNFRHPMHLHHPVNDDGIPHY